MHESQVNGKNIHNDAIGSVAFTLYHWDGLYCVPLKEQSNTNGSRKNMTNKRKCTIHVKHQLGIHICNLT